jgi:hypothetical protein
VHDYLNSLGIAIYTNRISRYNRANFFLLGHFLATYSEHLGATLRCFALESRAAKLEGKKSLFPSDGKSLVFSRRYPDTPSH